MGYAKREFPHMDQLSPSSSSSSSSSSSINANYSGTSMLCSKRCGGGQRERLVYCPEPARCEPTQKPNSTEPCNQHLCFRWQAMAWEECSVSCGGGVQRRVVTCANGESGGVEGGQCERSSRPDNFQKCNLQKCESGPVPRCMKDSMSTRFCEKLKLLGRCSLGFIWKQCCITCAG